MFSSCFFCCCPNRSGLYHSILEMVSRTDVAFCIYATSKEQVQQLLTASSLFCLCQNTKQKASSSQEKHTNTALGPDRARAFTSQAKSPSLCMPGFGAKPASLTPSPTIILLHKHPGLQNPNPSPHHNERKPFLVVTFKP
jgi:hypothetical protein